MKYHTLLTFLVAAAAASVLSAAEPKSTSLFNGQNLDNWLTKPGKGTNHWSAGIPALEPGNPAGLLVTGMGMGNRRSFAMINTAEKHGAGVDLYSKEKFGSCRIELEVMVPKGSNSGIYVMGEYEVQVFDSHGKQKIGPGDMGAIYGAAVPPVNAAKAPGEWQKYVIEWQAPKFDGEGRKTANGKFLKVELNGKILHKNLEMPGPTPAGVTGKEAAEGPLMFQGDHGPIAYRNILITPL